jgi:hypothetical protein
MIIFLQPEWVRRRRRLPGEYCSEWSEQLGRDVRAADLQEEPTKRVEDRAGFVTRSFRRVRRRRRFPGEYCSEWSEQLGPRCSRRRSAGGADETRGGQSCFVTRSFRRVRRRRRLPGEYRSERSEQLGGASLASEAIKPPLLCGACRCSLARQSRNRSLLCRNSSHCHSRLNRIVASYGPCRRTGSICSAA